MHLEQCLCSKQCKCWVSFNYSVSQEEDKIFKAEGTSCRGDREAEKPDRTPCWEMEKLSRAFVLIGRHRQECRRSRAARRQGSAEEGD